HNGATGSRNECRGGGWKEQRRKGESLLRWEVGGPSSKAVSTENLEDKEQAILGVGEKAERRAGPGREKRAAGRAAGSPESPAWRRRDEAGAQARRCQGAPAPRPQHWAQMRPLE
ncbi:hypothetical protein P7K49_026187, partial [Saguinus oedipus]